MEPIAVSTQKQYDEAQKKYQAALDTSYFDIDKGKGLEIVEEVDYLIYHFLCNGVSKEDTEKNLSRFYFDESQAEEITGYFLTHQPGDLYEIERGLNILNLSPDSDMNRRISPIQIRDSVEKIRVYYPVEVFGNSEVEAYGHARVIAHDTAKITAHDQAIVEALDTVQVKAFESSHITARNASAAMLFNRSTAMAYNHASINAGDYTKTAVFDAADAKIWDYARAEAYNKSLVTARNKAIIAAFHNATVNTHDYTSVTAKDVSYIFAKGSAIINAEGNAVVVAGDNVKVNAKHRSLVFAGPDAVCEHTDKTRIIGSAQNKPLFLKSNILRILDHPYINREPVIAVNLLLSSASPDDKEGFSRKLKEMGCTDPESTNRVLNILVKDFESAYAARPRLLKERRRDESWER
jgi:hypothetical protein